MRLVFGVDDIKLVNQDGAPSGKKVRPKKSNVEDAPAEMMSVSDSDRLEPTAPQF